MWIKFLIAASSLGAVVLFLLNIETIVDRANCWLVNPMLKRRRIHNNTWPLKITLDDIQVHPRGNRVLAIVLFELLPRCAALPDACRLTLLPSNQEFRPSLPMDSDTSPDWPMGKEQRHRRKLEMDFDISLSETDTHACLKMWADGHTCVSNTVAIPKQGGN